MFEFRKNVRTSMVVAHENHTELTQPGGETHYRLRGRKCRVSDFAARPERAAVRISPSGIFGINYKYEGGGSREG